MGELRGDGTKADFQFSSSGLASEDRPSRVAVLGLGNTLLGDDGVGPTVAQYLSDTFSFPADVSVADLGTPGLDLTPYLLGVESVLFIDAVAAGDAPGTVRLIPRSEILSAPAQPRVSPHDPGVQQALQIVELVEGRTIDVWVLGVTPHSVTIGEPLSGPVAAAVPQLVDGALDWLRARGVEPTPVRTPSEAS